MPHRSSSTPAPIRHIRSPRRTLGPARNARSPKSDLWRSGRPWGCLCWAGDPDFKAIEAVIGALLTLSDVIGLSSGGPTVIVDQPGDLGREMVANQRPVRSPLGLVGGLIRGTADPQRMNAVNDTGQRGHRARPSAHQDTSVMAQQATGGLRRPRAAQQGATRFAVK
ncbi:hypothetical protein GCM10027072_77660 [Streptomyces bullii]